MTQGHKDVGKLTPEDISAFPVWEFVLDREKDFGEAAVQPVAPLPVHSLVNRVVGTKIVLANGAQLWALIGNVDLENPIRTRHLIAPSLLIDGKWTYLARYHDLGQRKNGPAAIARLLGLRTSEAFPISYDISAYCVGDPLALAGTIESDPQDKLTPDELYEVKRGRIPPGR